MNFFFLTDWKLAQCVWWRPLSPYHWLSKLLWLRSAAFAIAVQCAGCQVSRSFLPTSSRLDCVSKAKKTDPITKWTRQEIVSSTFFWVSWSQQGWQTGVEQPRDEVVALLLLYHVKKCGTHDVRTQGIPTYSVQLAKNVIWDAFTLQLPGKIRNKRESQSSIFHFFWKQCHSGNNPFKMCHAAPLKS